MISSERELEERLSLPTTQDIDALREMTGDVLILGVSGKMGPSLARRVRRAADAAGVKRRVIGAARFSEPGSERLLQEAGIETQRADLLSDEDLAKLPDAENVIYMAARKFGSTGAESLTWAINTYLPGRVAERYKDSKIVAFSSGNVYPLMPVLRGGATEKTPPGPVGEYAQSVLGRERVFEHFSAKYGTKVCLLRLNYAIDLRYGVLLDIGTKVFESRPVDLTMGLVNVIWQGDANSITLRSFAECQSPPKILNLTGPETVSVRALAGRFGEIFGKTPVLQGQESETALLNDASYCHKRYGYPTVSLTEMIEWTANWISIGGGRLNKPTHFQTRDGKF